MPPLFFDETDLDIQAHIQAALADLSFTEQPRGREGSQDEDSTDRQPPHTKGLDDTFNKDELGELLAPLTSDDSEGGGEYLFSSVNRALQRKSFASRKKGDSSAALSSLDNDPAAYDAFENSNPAKASSFKRMPKDGPPKRDGATGRGEHLGAAFVRASLDFASRAIAAETKRLEAAQRTREMVRVFVLLPFLARRIGKKALRSRPGR